MLRRYWVLLGCLCLVGAVVFIGLPREAAAPPGTELERFDVKKGTVVARTASTPEIQAEASKLLHTIGGPLNLFRADPEDGTILRIPLRPSIQVRTTGFNALANEMFLFLPKGEAPYILVFSDENEPRLFAFQSPVDKLLQLCGWEDARAS